MSVSENFRATEVARFLAAAAAASGAMTASQRAEMLVTGRAPSDVPVQAVERMTGLAISGSAARIVVGHVAQGSLAAVAVALAGRTRRVPALPATTLIAASLIAGDAVLATTLGLAESPWRWARRDLAIDVMHKTSLAVAARTIVARASRPVR